jgi:putative flavoprotein involved in K+ transport
MAIGRNVERVPAVVVGAGPAGVAVSSRLGLAGVPHVVLERGRIGWSWRTQRWDSFRLNTPVWANLVPGELLPGDPDDFATAASLVAGLEELAEALPVQEHVDVLRASWAGRAWVLETSASPIAADAVVVASGFQNVPRTPAYAPLLPERIRQLHVADYRRPDDVDGAVLVVGGAQSGVQVAEDLLDAGHDVYLCTSRVGRMPRRYRGRDAVEWMLETGQLDLLREDVAPEVVAATPPQVSGAAGGRTVSYQDLARRGATLLGRAAGWDGRRLRLEPDVGANVWFADEVAARFRAAWDRQAALTSGRIEPAGQLDPADEPAPELYGAPGPSSLDLRAAGITTVIWATGFGASTDWLPDGALDDARRPRLPRLHVVGAPWLTHRASGNLYGMAADAERVADALAGAWTIAA